MPFLSELVVRESTPGRWQLIEPLSYAGRTDRFEVPAGFDTDLASVPRFLRWLVPVSGRWTKAAVLHDWLWESRPVSYADADGVFRRTLRELGVPVLRRWLMWAGVRTTAVLRYERQDVLRRPLALLGLAAVAIPGLAFVLVPGVVALVFLALFWLAEAVTTLVVGARPSAPRPPRPPLVLPR